MPKPDKPKFVGWFPSATATDYEAGIDTNEKHSGTRCAYLKSLVPKPKQFGNLTQAFAPDKYFGKRLRMSAWVKTELKNQGKAQLWLRIDNADESKRSCRREHTYCIWPHAHRRGSNLARRRFI